ncbi:unnamed protein product [Rotaria magnacalcarata]|uniref:Uncharacterized protein n=1 Tax=Rotaria magnacalcarata TaxID=392030 RepID=A0A820XYF5_9BILA|nr:unnamed protein product [Rotaria magnacalcarata]
MASSSFNDKHSALRFADVGALSKRMLAPIDGYEKAPLVSLEEAVKPLVNIVPKIERNVYVVQENCQNQEDGLTTDESASIMLYTKNLVSWFLYLRLILTALARLPSKRRSVFRGVKENA